MKAVDSKSSATNAKSNSPFFSKGGEQGFFGASLNQNAFFSRSPGPIQAKLTVGQPGDMYEKEADNMADKVVQRLSEPSSVQTKPLLAGNSVSPLIQAKCAHCEAEEKLERKESDGNVKLIQQKPIFESEAEPDEGHVQRKCAHCEQEEKLRGKSVFESNEVRNEKSPNVQRKCASCEAEEKLQKKSDGSLSQHASPHVEAGLRATKGSGMPLPKDTRQQMESSFGADFSNVRIHNDSSAVKMNKDLNAQAFTHGSDIYFNDGKYNAGSQSGQHLLAHELTHVVQQTGLVQSKPEVSTSGLHTVMPKRISIVPPAPRISSISHLYNSSHLSTDSQNLVQRDASTPAPASGVTPPSPPPPGTPSNPPPSQKPDDGLVYINIPTWTVIEKRTQAAKLIEPWRAEIPLLAIPIPDFGTFDLTFKASMRADLNASLGPVEFKDLSIGMTKLTAAALAIGGGLAFTPVGPAPLLLALKYGYFHGFGKLRALGEISVTTSAECSMEASLDALAIKKLDIAKIAFGLSGSLGASLKGKAEGMTDVVIDHGHLGFRAAALMGIEGNLNASLNAFMEASVLFGLLKARLDKNWSLLKKDWPFAAYKPVGDMNLIYDWPSFTDKDTVFSVKEETIKAVIEAFKQAMWDGDKETEVKDKKLTGLESVSANFDMSGTPHKLYLSESGDKIDMIVESHPEGFIGALVSAKAEVEQKANEAHQNGQFIEEKKWRRYKGDLEAIHTAAVDVDFAIERDQNQIVSGTKGTNAEAKYQEWKRQIARLANFLRTAAAGAGVHALDEYFSEPPAQRYIPGATQNEKGKFIRRFIYESLHDWKGARDRVEKGEREIVVSAVELAQHTQDKKDWERLKEKGWVEKNASINFISDKNEYAYKPREVQYAVDHKESVAKRWSKDGWDSPSDDIRGDHFLERSNLRYVTEEFNLAKVSSEDGNYNPFVGPNFVSKIADGGITGAMRIANQPFVDINNTPLSNTVQKKDNGAGQMPDESKKESNHEPLQEVYFARKGTLYLVFPKTTTDTKQLAKFLFKAANKGEEDDVDTNPDLTAIVNAIKGMNGMMFEDIYAHTPVMLGDLLLKYGFTDKAAYMFLNGPIFAPGVYDPEAELQKMNVSSIESFVQRKQVLDLMVQTDIFMLISLINTVKDEGIFGNQRGIESAVLEIFKKWIHEPLVKYHVTYPNGYEYFDKILLALNSNTLILHNILSDEWTSSYALIFNRFIFVRDELKTYRDAYSVTFKNDKPIAELSVWTDLAKPMLLRIPGAITEEVACFIKSVPLDIAKDAGEALEKKAGEYMDAVLDDKEGNELAMTISCAAGGLAFDLIGGLAKVKAAIQALNAVDTLYKAYKQVDKVLDNLPTVLSLMEDKDKFLDVLFGIAENDQLDNLQNFVMAEEPAPQPKADTNEGGIARFLSVINSFVSVIKKILRPVFAIRQKFLSFIQEAEDVLISNPLFLKFITALMAGKKIKEFADKNMSKNVAETFTALLGEVKEMAAGIIQGIDNTISNTIDGLKKQMTDAISDFVITEISKVDAVIKLVLKAAKAKVEKLISDKIIEPLLGLIGINEIIDRIKSIVASVSQEATKAVNFVIDGFGDFITNKLKDLHLQLKSKEHGTGGDDQNGNDVKNLMSGSTGHRLPDATQDSMETAFGKSFSDVRIHHDGPAQQANEHLHANAFTHENDIYFNSGQFDPESKQGQKLIAHELTHVVQQNNGHANGTVQRSLQDIPGNIFTKILKEFFEKRNPEAQKFTAIMTRPRVSQYELFDLRYAVAKNIDPKLLDMAFDQRKKLMGTVKDSFSRNIATAKVIVNEDRQNPQYMVAVNRPTGQHSEQQIGKKVEALAKRLRKKKAKSKKASADDNPITVRVEQIYTERKPCATNCVPFMRNTSVFAGAAVFYTINDETGRRENLMKAYGFSEETIKKVSNDDL